MKSVRWYPEWAEGKGLLGRVLGGGRRNRVPDLGSRISRTAYHGPMPDLTSDPDQDGWAGEGTPFVQRVIRVSRVEEQAGTRIAQMTRADRRRAEREAKKRGGKVPQGPAVDPVVLRADRIARLPDRIRNPQGGDIRVIKNHNVRRNALSKSLDKILRAIQRDPRRFEQNDVIPIPKVSEEDILGRLEEIHGPLRTRDQAVAALKKAFPKISIKAASDEDTADRINALFKGRRGAKTITAEDVREHQRGSILGVLHGLTDNPDLKLDSIDFTIDHFAIKEVEDAAIAGETFRPGFAEFKAVQTMFTTGGEMTVIDTDNVDDPEGKYINIAIHLNPLGILIQKHGNEGMFTALTGESREPLSRDLAGRRGNAWDNRDNTFIWSFGIAVHETGHVLHNNHVAKELGIDREALTVGGRTLIGLEGDDAREALKPFVPIYSRAINQARRDALLRDLTRSGQLGPFSMADGDVEPLIDALEKLTHLIKTERDSINDAAKEWLDEKAASPLDRSNVNRILGMILSYGIFDDDMLPEQVQNFVSGDYPDISNYAGTNPAELIAEMYTLRSQYIIAGESPPAQIEAIVAKALGLMRLAEKVMRFVQRVVWDRTNKI